MGVNAGNNDKSFSYGYGIGHEMKLGNRFTLNPELTTQYMYLGNWNYHNQLSRLQVLANIKLGKNIALFGGPVYWVTSSTFRQMASAHRHYGMIIPRVGLAGRQVLHFSDVTIFRPIFYF